MSPCRTNYTRNFAPAQALPRAKIRATMPSMLPAASITFFEHETRPFDWTDREFRALETINRAAGTIILRATVTANGQHALQAAQHVGVVRLGSRTVQILPKIYRHEAEREEEATRNLLHLLAIAGNVKVSEQQIAPLLRRRADWFEILTRLFATNLREAWQRSVVRGYVTCEEDASPVLRGRWRIGEQLRHPERRHQFAVAFDEFTADNPLNRVLRFVVERLWGLTRNGENRSLLSTLRVWMDEVTLLPAVRASDADPAALARLHPSYVPLLTLARLFLDGGALEPTSGDCSSFAFTFDMNRLFESFVAAFMRRHRHAILPAAWADFDLRVQSAGSPVYLATENAAPRFRLKPDVLVHNPNAADGPRFPLLLDTKYKTVAASDAVTPPDMYQMYAYARRFASPCVLLLYPQTAAPFHTRFILDDDGKIEAATINLRVDLGKPSGVQQLIDEFAEVLKGEAEP